MINVFIFENVVLIRKIDVALGYCYIGYENIRKHSITFVTTPSPYYYYIVNKIMKRMENPEDV